MNSRRTLAAIAAALVIALASTPPAAAADHLLVFAAASLKNALDAAVQGFEHRGGEQVLVSYAASSALARQIENGAPADVFISADLAWMNDVAKHGLIAPATRTNLLGNKLVLIAPKGSGTAGIDIAPGFPLATLLKGGRLAMADPDAVPAGLYGKAALEKLGVWKSVADKVARAADVRAALRFVSRGEAPLGIVYQTDAVADPGVSVVGRFPDGSYPPIIYPIAALAQAKQGAAKFIAFLRSPAARPFFEAQGFTVLE